MLLMLDNYDSFTFNLVQYFQELGQQVAVHRNDTIGVADVRDMQPEFIVISPGPGNPDEAGISLDLVRDLGGQIPILGVCLGHQVIAQCFGGKVVHARQVMHGKTSLIHHNARGVFRSLPSPFEATRYHSLVAEPASLPAVLEVTAWTVTPAGVQEEIMGIRHRELPIYGVQFHPEAILTEHGHHMLRNFLLANHPTNKAA